MCKRALIPAVAAVLAVVATVEALQAKDKYTATALFSAGDVRATGAVTYHSSFSGELWESFSAFGFGTGSSRGNEAVENAAGDLFFSVDAFNPENENAPYYTGILQFDGTDWLHLVQRRLEWNTDGDWIWSLTVAPATAGGVTAGHPVFLQKVWANSAYWGMEVWTVDPTTSPPELTLLHSFPNRSLDTVVVDEDGTIYAGPDQIDNTIRELTWNGSSYDNDAVPTTLQADHGLALGPDGYLYALDVTASWGTQQRNKIHQIDPATGATSVYARLSSFTQFYDWAWDSNGKFWVEARKTSGGGWFVAEIRAGRTVKGSIASSADELRSLGAGVDSALIVLEKVYQDGADHPLDTIYTLVRNSGGGKGGGKGK